MQDNNMYLLWRICGSFWCHLSPKWILQFPVTLQSSCCRQEVHVIVEVMSKPTPSKQPDMIPYSRVLYVLRWIGWALGNWEFVFLLGPEVDLVMPQQLGDLYHHFLHDNILYPISSTVNQWHRWWVVLQEPSCPRWEQFHQVTVSNTRPCLRVACEQ